jgi:hypothetical protein
MNAKHTFFVPGVGAAIAKHTVVPHGFRHGRRTAAWGRPYNESFGVVLLNS